VVNVLVVIRRVYSNYCGRGNRGAHGSYYDSGDKRNLL
jgi:hypothetical protein